MTPAKLAEIELLAAAASPGPWTKGRSYESVIAPIESGADDPREDARHYGGALVAESVFRAGDNAFIRAARTAVPELCADVRRLRSALEAIVAEHVKRCRECDAPAGWIELVDHGGRDTPWCDEHVGIPQKAISKGANRYQPQRIQHPAWLAAALEALTGMVTP